jgi:hypothetical protein
MSLSAFLAELLVLLSRSMPALTDEALAFVLDVANREKQRRLAAGSLHEAAQAAVDAALGQARSENP